jgi:hypothetical protein
MNGTIFICVILDLNSRNVSKLIYSVRNYYNVAVTIFQPNHASKVSLLLKYESSPEAFIITKQV